MQIKQFLIFFLFSFYFTVMISVQTTEFKEIQNLINNNNIENAINLLNTLLNNKTNNKEELIKIKYLLGNCYFKIENYEKTFEYLASKEMANSEYSDEIFYLLDDLLLNNKVPNNLKDIYRRSFLDFVKNLNNIKIKSINIELPTLKPGYKEKFRSLNPSIIKNKNYYNLICRTINSGRINNKYVTLINGEIFKTVNFFLTYDKDLNLVSQSEITYDRSILPKCEKYDELADCRLFFASNELWFICAINIAPKSGLFPKQGIIKLPNLSNKSKKFHLENILLFDGPK